MLIFTRKPGQSLSIHPHPTLDPGAPVEQLFVGGPIQVQVLGVQGPQVRLGVAAPAGLCIRRDELFLRAAVSPLSEGARRVLARKLKVLMVLNLHSTHSLAAAAGLAPERVRAAESGVGGVGARRSRKDCAGVGGEGGGTVSLAGADGGGAGDLGVVGGGGVYVIVMGFWGRGEGGSCVDPSLPAFAGEAPAGIQKLFEVPGCPPTRA